MTTDMLFYELLQVAVSGRESLSVTPTADEWEALYDSCKRQTLVGIGYVAMRKLPSEQWPPRRTVMRWAGLAEKIKCRNLMISDECAAVCRVVCDDGLHACVLKGQSNLVHYGDIGMYRTPGDIDLWVWSSRNRVSDVIEYAKKKSDGSTEVNYHHSDCPLSRITEVEVHHRPSWMSAPWCNGRLQRFCRSHQSDIVQYEGFYVPSSDFDAVYQLVHIYRHLFSEGIGLRQLLDYFMLLKDIDEDTRDASMRMLCSFGMRRFVGAVMWVLQEVFALGREHMLCDPDMKNGRFLLTEIMLAGNFGHADERIKVTRNENRLKWGWMKLARNMKFIGAYPEEVLCEPLFRVYHWMWRHFKFWKI